jgi:bacteriophage N4 adsorption protein B
VRLDHWVVASLVPLVLWILLSGLDDLFIGLVCLFPGRERFRWPTEAERAAVPQRRIAILVPLWREDSVIEQMLERNLSAIGYREYDIFCGVYPNDEPTIEAVERVARRHSRVHLAVCLRPGPTSKGDCLNTAYRIMAGHELKHGLNYEIVMMHDAEDVIHADSLSLVNYFSRDYEMVQMPILPLATHPRDFTHGVYCDEFAEFQTRDIPVRQRLGGFIPSTGVGTGFSRAALERLAGERGGRVFDPDCLTEDYETGFCLHAMGCRQIFLPVRFDREGPVATREYFPRTFHAAVRQRSRWVAGIALQGWERHGWRASWLQRYWFFRDRKGLIGNLLSPFANLVMIYDGLAFLEAVFTGQPWRGSTQICPNIAALSAWTFWISLAQTTMRVWSCAWIYGWRFALTAPGRTMWANALNCAATLQGARDYFGARLTRSRLEWRKTDHFYPGACEQAYDAAPSGD